jgi:hypothetical protein
VIVLVLAMLAGCVTMPDGARLPTPDESAEVADVVSRFEARLPLSQECRAFASRTHVLDAPAGVLVEMCRMCAPVEAGEDWCDRQRYGAAAACLREYERAPLVVIWDGLEAGDFLRAVHHESTHAVGLCERVPGSYGHGSTVLWGADGVHPL